MMTNDNAPPTAEKNPPKVHPWKDSPVTREFETLAKNTLKGELKRRGITLLTWQSVWKRSAFPKQSGT